MGNRVPGRLSAHRYPCPCNSFSSPVIMSAAAAAAARCFRSMPTAFSMAKLSRSSPSSVTIVCSALPRAATSLPAGISPELAKLLRRFDGAGAGTVSSLNAADDGGLIPALEVVNRNARRPKKVCRQHGRICASSEYVGTSW